MDFTKMAELGNMNGFDLFKIMELLSEHGPKIKAFIPKAIEMLPQVKAWEKTKNLKQGEILVYSAITTNSNVYIYVNRTIENEKGNPECIETIERFDLMELINKAIAYIP